MATSQYKKFLRLVQAWPVDTLKEGTDLGQHIRIQVGEKFRHGDMTTVNEVECEQAYNSMNRIANDYYFNLYKRTSLSSATGLPAALCREAVSVDNLSTLRYDNQRGMFNLKQLFRRFSK